MKENIEEPPLHLEVAMDTDTNIPFLKHAYNTGSEDSFRSPWSSKYYPDLPNGPQPSGELRKLEEQANQIFQQYVFMYYDQAISSVYFIDNSLDFDAAFLIKKELKDKDYDNNMKNGYWDSISIVSASLETTKHSNSSHEQQMHRYRVNTRVVLTLECESDELGKYTLTGNHSAKRDEHVRFDERQD
mmetsp:Transcript_446/g.249  ORF Transcript_446/g.249 Transcript_446/m.249 type:complete len:187 (+) Transcript_446:138-698(+)|eukprot:CAMPEP_0116873832 /NCGR_PEP_ID=MMETSP0463-20121206/5140_1 /TAXON_ID=181622 /ORGANISM="Strombidinopsis sp, Strain SopsisLIS2011" /LENGTH=186 /DNA_ID=CAMNT_0004516563 /DNA_START=86 /DNA_END=646 /DNA_ORIENTATION=+